MAASNIAPLLYFINQRQIGFPNEAALSSCWVGLPGFHAEPADLMQASAILASVVIPNRQLLTMAGVLVTANVFPPLPFDAIVIVAGSEI